MRSSKVSEREYCGVSEGDCLNPAGYVMGLAGAGDTPDPPRTSATCSWCGTVACRNCRVEKPRRLCLYCADDPDRGGAG